MTEPKNERAGDEGSSELSGVAASPPETLEPRSRPVAEETSESAPEPSAQDPATEEPSLDARPKKRRRKKKKLDEVLEESAVERAELDANGRERARFLLKFPRDAALEELIAAFERGDYGTVRELAPRLIERTERSDVQAAARELLKRIEPDPVVKFLLFAAIALFVVVVAYVYYAHG